MILQPSLVPHPFFFTVLTVATICLGSQDFLILAAVGSICDENKTAREISAQPNSSKYRPLDDIKNLQGDGIRHLMHFQHGRGSVHSE
jgi:hypothetical protein